MRSGQEENKIEQERLDIELEDQIRKEVDDLEKVYINPFKAREYMKFLLKRIDELEELLTWA